MRKIAFRLVLFLLAVISVLATVLPLPVAYAATGSPAIIRNKPLTIHKGQTVEDVVVLGHNVTVKGSVTEVLVVVDGNIRLTSTSRTGIVLDLGGKIQQDKGASVKAFYGAPLHTPFWNGVLFGGMIFLLLWAALLAVGIGLVLLSVLISYVLRKQITVPLNEIERSVRRTGLTGLLASLAVLAVGALGAVTVIGLPIAGLLGILYLLAGVVGFAVASLWGGRLALRHSPTEWEPWQQTLLGSSLIFAFSSIPFIGLLLFAGFWLIGIGAVTVWLSRLWQQRKQRINKANRGS